MASPPHNRALHLLDDADSPFASPVKAHVVTEAVARVRALHTPTPTPGTTPRKAGGGAAAAPPGAAAGTLNLKSKLQQPGTEAAAADADAGAAVAPANWDLPPIGIRIKTLDIKGDADVGGGSACSSPAVRRLQFGADFN